MDHLFQPLESRTLFAAIPSGIAVALAKVDSDIAVIKQEFAADNAVYAADSKTIQANLKTLPKSKTNSKDVATLAKIAASARAVDTRDLAKYDAVGLADAAKVKALYVAYLKKPTVKTGVKLTAAIGTWESAPVVWQDKFLADVAAGDQKIDAQLTVIEAANPSDSALDTEVTSAETDQATGYTVLAASYQTLNDDVVTLGDELL